MKKRKKKDINMTKNEWIEFFMIGAIAVIVLILLLGLPSSLGLPNWDGLMNIFLFHEIK